MKIKFFDLAKKARLSSDHHQHQMACIIAKGNKLISIGVNKLKTHPASQHPYRSLHAEVSALIKADPNELIGAQAYIYREKKNGELGNSRPCNSCFLALQEAGICSIFYCTENGFKEEKI